MRPSLRSLMTGALVALLVSGALGADSTAPSVPPLLRLVADIPMPGDAVRFDYQSLDPVSGRLYIAHMNANQLVVFDTRSRKVVANLDGFARVHGVWAVLELGRVDASRTGLDIGIKTTPPSRRGWEGHGSPTTPLGLSL